MHEAAYQYIAQRRSLAERECSVLEFGGRDINGTVRPLFAEATCYTSVDIAEGPCVDVVGDCAEVDLGRTFDVVVSTELLEHTPRGAEIVANAHRHIRPGGVFIATMAGPGRAPHGASGERTPPPYEWYENVEPETLRRWLTDAGFVDIDIDTNGTDLRCVAYVEANRG